MWVVGCVGVKVHACLLHSVGHQGQHWISSSFALQLFETIYQLLFCLLFHVGSGYQPQILMLALYRQSHPHFCFFARCSWTPRSAKSFLRRPLLLDNLGGMEAQWLSWKSQHQPWEEPAPSLRSFLQRDTGTSSLPLTAFPTHKGRGSAGLPGILTQPSKCARKARQSYSASGAGWRRLLSKALRARSVHQSPSVGRQMGG